MGSKWDGIIRLSLKRRKFQIRNYVIRKKTYSLSNNSVYCIYQDLKKDVDSTHGGGINYFKKRQMEKSFLHNGNLLKIIQKINLIKYVYQRSE